MSPSNKSDQRLIVGGVPRADLLPPELEQEKRARATRRALVFVVALVLILTAVVYVAISAVAAGAQFAVDSANARTGELIQEQGQYIEVRQVQAKVDAAKQARLIGTSTEVDWLAIKDDLVADLPENMIITGWTVQTSTPFLAFGETTVPFERPRQLEMTLGGVTSTAENVSSFYENIKMLPGFADATIKDVSYSPEAAVYTWVITLHLNEGAFTNRFATTTEETN